MRASFTLLTLLLCLPLAGCWSSATDDPTAATPETAEQKFTKELSALLKDAAEQEKKGNTSAAMDIWTKVVETVKAEHGEDAWQTLNATLAYNAAKQRSELPSADRNLISQLATSESEGVRALNTNPREATYHLEEAEKLVRQIYGEDSHLLRNVRMAQAQALASLGDTPGATDVYGQVYAWRMKNLGRNHPDTLEVVSRLGLLQQHAQNLSAAVENLNAAVDIARKVWGDDHPQTAEHLNNLAMLEYAAGQYDRSATRLEDVLTVRRAALKKTTEAAIAAGKEKVDGKSHPAIRRDQEAVAHTLYNLGNVELKRGRLQQGTDYLAEAWKTVDQDGKGLATLVGTAYSHALSAQRNYAPAEAVMAKIKQWQETAGGESHPDYAKTLYQLAIIQGNQGKFTDAEPHLAKAIELERNSGGDYSQTLTEMLSVHAQLLRRTGNIAAAETAEAERERLRSGGVQTATRPW